ncbi:alpha/beta hydrolase family protein [Sphingobium phenoxybenzoativorans]|uniref:alpha/beta hydrolase family protein n=1 Tax=Sphingobium phenoxybenzoativorans TaxID=1592790 RepID=UPI0008723DB7|nr:S9 family peptidase [Sphingobium phenoxybenzoativorans]
MRFFTKCAGLAGAALLAAAYPAEAQDAVKDPAGSAVKRWPVEAFAELPFMDNLQLSPAGDKIAARVAINAEQRFVIMDIHGRNDRSRVMSLGDNDLNWWTWVNDDWLLLGLGAEQPMEGMPWYITRAVGLSVQTAKVNMLASRTAAQNGDDAIWIARDGTPRILLSYQTSIYGDNVGFWPKVDEVDISTGRLRTVVASHSNVRSWYADASGTVRMGIGYNDAQRTSTMLYRPDAKTAFKTVARANRRKDESLIVPQLFLPEAGKAIASDDSDGAEALYEFDLTTLELGKKIFEVPGYDIGEIVPDRTQTGLAGVRYTDERRRVHWFDSDLATVQADIDKAVGTRRATITSMSRDQSKLLVHVGGPDRPGAYYYFDRPSGAMNLLARVNETIGLARLAPVRTVRYKARDGLEIAAVLTVPEGRPEKNLPLILMPHGGPFARDEESWDWWVQFLANRGYVVLQPNYRGSSGYGSSFAEKGEGQWGLAMQDDLNDAVDWAVKEGIADPKRVCIAGASYGGYAAMRAAQRDGGKFRCAISYAGVSDLAAMMRYDSRFLYHGARSDWLKAQAPDYRAVSPVNFASSFSTPILLMHGKKDRRVQVGQSREMAEKLKAAGKDYIYVEQPLGDHHFSREADRLDFLKRLEAFLAEHNPA